MIVAAAKVGGIAFNSANPVGFMADNLAIALNVIRTSHAVGVKKLLFLALLWQITHAAVRCRATFDSADIAEDLVE